VPRSPEMEELTTQFGKARFPERIGSLRYVGYSLRRGNDLPRAWLALRCGKSAARERCEKRL